MSNASNLTDTYPDWESIYQDVQNSPTNQIPNIAEKRKESAGRVIVRDMYVDFRDLMEKLADWIAEGINALFVYADVVRFPDDYTSQRLDIYIQIAARRIEVGIDSNVWLDYRTSDLANFTLYTNQILGYLHVVAEFDDADKSKTYILRDFEHPRQRGVTIFCASGGESVQAPIYWMKDLIINDNPDFYLSLSSIFQFATLFFDRNPDLAYFDAGMDKG